MSSVASTTMSSVAPITSTKALTRSITTNCQFPEITPSQATESKRLLDLAEAQEVRRKSLVENMDQTYPHLDSFYKRFWEGPDHCSCRDENGNDIGDDKCRGECLELPWHTNMEDEYAYMDFLSKTN